MPQHAHALPKAEGVHAIAKAGCYCCADANCMLKSLPVDAISFIATNFDGCVAAVLFPLELLIISAKTVLFQT